ncbi:MAG: methyltransferase domain-containing protein [Deltaproteobacteria bacterium]|nr:methyltransferase domain-containing protein [Deltaproteobacteria bacterium]
MHPTTSGTWWRLALVAPLLACGAGRDEPAAAVPSAASQPAATGDQPSPGASGSAPSPKSSPGSAPRDGTQSPGPDDVPPTHFEGREIATTMSYRGADWLTRSNRDAEEDTVGLHRALELVPGQTACDVGAGNGYHTTRMAQAVGPTGRVLAVDLQPQMLEKLRTRVEAQGLDNVETILAQPGDPKLPEGRCDLILLVDVYHELAWPEPMLAAFRRALSADGRLALVEFRAEDPSVPIKKLHKMSKAQIERELSPRGLSLVGSVDTLPWQHLVFYAAN